MAHKVKTGATVNGALQQELEEPSIAAYLNFSAIL